MARRRAWGMRLTERLLLPFTGPASVASLDRATTTTPEQRARAEALEDAWVRVTGPDGRSYMVERASAPDAPPETPPLA